MLFKLPQIAIFASICYIYVRASPPEVCAGPRFFMKADIHPTFYPKAKITCACGATLITGATRENIHVEVCSNCHPFFTGGEKIIDTAGRVERFKQRQAKATARPAKKSSAKKSKA